MEKLRSLLRPSVYKRRAAARFKAMARELSNQGDLNGPVLYDIGARWGVSPPYDRLSAVRGFHSVGFEPDAAEAAKLRAAGAFHGVYPVALGARPEKRVLHLAKDPGSSSLLAPNAAEIGKYTDWLLYETVKKIEVSVEPLDDVIAQHKLPPPDYLKIDCEGAEGEILAGAPKALAQLCGLTFEARIPDFYNGGATLSGLLSQMSAADFVPLRLDPVGSYFGAQVLFDVVMVRHPATLRTRRQFMFCVLFCLLHGNWLYAKRTAELRARDFGGEAVLGMF